MPDVHHRAQPLWVAGDLDGFFGLAVDNLIQFILILGLCGSVLGFPEELILGRILPGAALSIVVGNLFYAWQAQRLSARTGRRDVTALPYGINTVSLFAYVFLVMLPVKLGAGDAPDAATRAWQVGLAACFFSGVIELLGSFFAEWIRRHTPRAALLSTLAGIAISFISIDFAVRTFAAPIVAILPLAVILATYFSKTRMPLHLPGGLWAVLMGSAAAWIAQGLHVGPELVNPDGVKAALANVGLHLPIPVVSDLVAGLTHGETYLYVASVFLPMGLFNVLGSLQNIESAEAAGDRYPTLPSLAVNGIGTMVAASFGSCFPTTIYIGHPGWKGIGARSGYSVANGLVFCLVAIFGVTALVSSVFPLEAGMAIVLWIGIVITAQAFQATPGEEAPAVAVGLFPAICAWGVLILGQALSAIQMHTGDFTLGSAVLADGKALQEVGLNLRGFEALGTGFMLTCTLWSAISAHLIHRQFRAAAIWTVLGGILSLVGLIHVGHMSPEGLRYDLGERWGWEWAIGYALAALFFAILHLARGQADAPKDSPSEAPVAQPQA